MFCHKQKPNETSQKAPMRERFLIKQQEVVCRTAGVVIFREGVERMEVKARS